MIKPIDKKPKGLFEDLPENYLWFELYHGDKVYCYVGIEIISIWASFHIHVVKWTHSIVKTLHSDWESLKELCRNVGAQEAIASNKNLNDTRWPKFIKMFGFSEPQRILISKQRL